MTLLYPWREGLKGGRFGLKTSFLINLGEYPPGGLNTALISDHQGEVWP
jgi:hypothetical protein